MDWNLRVYSSPFSHLCDLLEMKGDSYSFQSPCMDLCLISSALLNVETPHCYGPSRPSHFFLQSLLLVSWPPPFPPQATCIHCLCPVPHFPTLSPRHYEWHFMKLHYPYTGCDTHGMWFSSYFWKSESTSQDDSLKIDNRFSSRKLQGKFNSFYFKKILLKFRFLKSQKNTFLALQVIHILKLCSWSHCMRYFILLMLGKYVSKIWMRSRTTL